MLLVGTCIPRFIIGTEEDNKKTSNPQTLGWAELRPCEQIRPVYVKTYI